jgi:hypothetical protein
MTNKIIGTVAVLALLVGAFALYAIETYTPSQPVGAVSGSDFYNQVNEHAGEVNSGQLATTSLSTAETISGNEFIGWANSSVVSYIPIGTAADTITFPASSSLKSLVPNQGDSQRFCFRNATTTANVTLTFAGGTGTDLLVASSSVSALGSSVVASDKVACFTLMREAPTASTYDIEVLMTAFQ